MSAVDLLLLDQAPDLARVELRDAARSCCRRSCRPCTAHCVAPCMSGAIGRKRDRAGLAALGHVLGALRARAGHRVDAAAEREEHVLVSPDDALRHAGRAAGVEDVAVVAGARREVALGRARRQRLLVLDRAERRVSRRRCRPRSRSRAQLRQRVAHARDARRELALVDEADQVGVVEQVAELVLDVAVVDVDPDRAQLEDRPERLDPLDASCRRRCRRGRRAGRPARARWCASRFARASISP